MHRFFLFLGCALSLLGADPLSRFHQTREACEVHKRASACALMYSYYVLNKQTFVPGFKADLKKALHYAKKACDLGDEDGCYFAGMTLYYGDDWEKIERDREKGKAYIKKACKMGKADVCSYFP